MSSSEIKGEVFLFYSLSASVVRAGYLFQTKCSWRGWGSGGGSAGGFCTVLCHYCTCVFGLTGLTNQLPTVNQGPLQRPHVLISRMVRTLGGTRFCPFLELSFPEESTRRGGFWSTGTFACCLGPAASQLGHCWALIVLGPRGWAFALSPRASALSPLTSSPVSRMEGWV